MTNIHNQPPAALIDALRPYLQNQSEEEIMEAAERLMTYLEYTATRWAKMQRDPELMWRWEIACFENRLRRKKQEGSPELLRQKRGHRR